MLGLYTSTYKIYINHTDAGGIVYHGNYLTFYENCRRDWLEQIGFDSYFFAQEDINGITVSYHPVISHADIRYHKPILLDTLIEVTIDAIKIKPASLIFNQSIYDTHSKQKLSSCQLTVACVTNSTNDKGDKIIKPARLPDVLIKAIKNWQVTP